MSYGQGALTTRKALIEAARTRTNKRAPADLRVVKDVAGLVQPAGPRSFRFTLSTATVDRASDRVNQAGWDLSAYKRNPVVLLDHGMHPVLGYLPIGRGIDVRVEGGKLKGTVVLDQPTVPIVGPYAEMVKQKLENGSLFACSVGFRPIDFDVADDRDPLDLGLDFIRQELTEWSVVSIPCNPDCLADESGDLATAISSVTARAPADKTKAQEVARRLRQIDLRWPG